MSSAQESTSTLEKDRQQEGYPWVVSEPVGNMLREMKVLVQSTKVGIDSRGVIVYRAGYGQGREDDWRQVFQDLADSAQ